MFKMYQILIRFLSIFLIIIRTLLKSKSNLLLENVALRQQLSTYLIKKTEPKLMDLDRAFWVALMQVFSKWMDCLIIVKPQTVIDWQKRRFKKHWTKSSIKNKNPGKKKSRRKFEI